MNSKKFWIFRFLTGGKSPVLDNAAGGLLCASILGGLGIAYSYASRVVAYFAEIVDSYRHPVIVSYGEYLGLYITTVLLSAYLIFLIIAKLRIPERQKYTADAFYGFIWRWRPGLGDDDENIYSVEAYCPADDTKIVWRDRSEKCFGFCTYCGKRTEAAWGLEVHFKSERIPLAVGRNLRNGEWKQAGLRISQLRDDARPMEPEAAKVNTDKAGNEDNG